MKTINTLSHLPYTFILILLLSILFSSCEIVISAIEGDQPLPEEPGEGVENQNDPDNPDFSLPLIDLSDEPFTIEEDQFTLDWNVVDTAGNPLTFENLTFSIAYAKPGEEITEDKFIDLQSSTLYQFPDLEETFGDELYSFEIRMRSTDENVPESKREKTFTGTFRVDINKSTGFIFKESEIAQNTDGQFKVRVYLDEIEVGDDLMAFSLVVDYNSEDLTISEENVEIFSDERSFLYRDANNPIIAFPTITSHQIIIDAGVAGNNLIPLDGGGAICEITFSPISDFTGSTISISNSTKLIKSDGSELPLEITDQVTLIY